MKKEEIQAMSASDLLQEVCSNKRLPALKELLGRNNVSLQGLSGFGSHQPTIGVNPDWAISLAESSQRCIIANIVHSNDDGAPSTKTDVCFLIGTDGKLQRTFGGSMDQSGLNGYTIKLFRLFPGDGWCVLQSRYESSENGMMVSSLYLIASSSEPLITVKHRGNDLQLSANGSAGTPELSFAPLPSEYEKDANGWIIGTGEVLALRWSESGNCFTGPADAMRGSAVAYSVLEDASSAFKESVRSPQE
ncbi:hypothetical protein N9N28_15165 [Rubripirellula amarantea]|nr:hypothetical protein [Rubripirellula amarantea]